MEAVVALPRRRKTSVIQQPDLQSSWNQTVIEETDSDMMNDKSCSFDHKELEFPPCVIHHKGLTRGSSSSAIDSRPKEQVDKNCNIVIHGRLKKYSSEYIIPRPSSRKHSRSKGMDRQSHRDDDKDSGFCEYSRQRESVMESLDEFFEWLDLMETSVSDTTGFTDIIKAREKRKELEDLYDDIEDHQSKVQRLSEQCQKVAQRIPPGPDRTELKEKISSARRRMMSLKNLAMKQKETVKEIIPLNRKFGEFREEFYVWFEQAQKNAEPFIEHHNDDSILLEHGDEIERLFEDLDTQRHTYESLLTTGETIIDTCPDQAGSTQKELDGLVEKWDGFVSNLDKCVMQLEVARRIDEETRQTETQRIDSQIRREARKCNCHSPFQIVRVGEGKYLFGESKVVRLVRIHGSSIVVRVGGGWEFLREFLRRSDPCRAKQYESDPVEALKDLGILPNGHASDSFAFEIRQSYVRGVVARDKKCCGNGNLSASVDCIDTPCGGDSPRSLNGKPKSARRWSSVTPGRRKPSDCSLTPNRAESPDLTRRPSTDRTPVRRRSLIERQSDYGKSKGMTRVGSVDSRISEG